MKVDVVSSRQRTFDALRQNPKVSVLVVGGGINGISAFRELALQGVDVVMIDKGDFCSGASAALSRMVHGGLRYLENGEFKLVRESLRERDRLRRTAPHYVAPLPTMVPVFDIFSGLLNGAIGFFGASRRPGRRGAIAIKVGLTLYDRLTSGGRALSGHRLHGHAQTLLRWPQVNGAVRCSATYHDAWVSHPERLGVEMLTDIARERPLCHALNYASVMGSSNGRLAVTDELTADSVAVEPNIVVNATGAWIDRTNALLAGESAAPAKLIGGTKGSHLVIDSPALLAALGGHMVYYEHEDGRICIAFPYLGRVLAGSTDIRVDNPEDTSCEDAERDYILRSLRYVFPTIDVAESDIVYRFSGVRPLSTSADKITGRIPRDHFCQFVTVAPSLPPVLCMIGGKWTTFRAFGEQAADMVLERLGRTRSIDTAERPIGGGADYPAGDRARKAWVDAFAARYGIGRERGECLLARYGTYAAPIGAFIAGGADRPLGGAGDFSARELLYLIRNERVECLEDLLLRRTTLAITGAITAAVVNDALDILASERGWGDNRGGQERQRFFDRLERLHGVTETILVERDKKRGADAH